MSLHVEVWSDFVCPWCYLVSKSLEKLEASHGVTISWRAFELRPPSAPPMSESYKQRIEAMRPRMVAMAQDMYGIVMAQGPFGINSRPALMGEKFANHHDVGAAYHKAVFEAYFLHEMDISDTDLLADIAQRVGLDGDAFLESLNDPTLSAQIEADVRQAQAYDIQGVPAMIFEQKYYIPGAQPYEELVRFVEQIKQRMDNPQ